MRWAFALLLACAAAVAQVAIPALSKRVTDTTMTLDAASIARIEAPLAALEAQKGAQIAVLLVPTTGEETIEAYALRAFEQWKLGRAGVDDGILLVLAMQDRAVRIEVGYGLEGAVPDLAAHRVIQEYLVPKLREGDATGGIEAAIGALAKLVQGEALPAPMSEPPPSSGGGGELAPSLMLFGVLAFFLNNFVGWLPRAVRSPLLGAGLGMVARLFFGASWPMVAVAVVVGVVVGLIRIVPGRVARGSGYGGMGGGGFPSSRGGGFGGGGGGGWSGGGGRSGGGGASGRW